MSRRSFGGAAVERSLASVQFEGTARRIALVETAAPTFWGHDTLLAQNAWNFIDESEFQDLSSPYPPKLIRRMVARRKLAQLNTRRAGRVVCLTEAMAAMVAEYAGGPVLVAPVVVPLDAIVDFGHLREKKVSEGAASNRILIPGSVTWYKRPWVAFDLALEQCWVDEGTEFVFAGGDDGSGCWADVLERAENSGLRATQVTMGRKEMLVALAEADRVILPSALESLGFSLAEALIHSSNVVASPIPAHLEIARRLRRSPAWIGAQAELSCSVEPLKDDEIVDLRKEWELLAATLTQSKGY